MVLSPFSPDALGLSDWPIVPHNVMSKSWEPCSIIKVPDCTQTFRLHSISISIYLAFIGSIGAMTRRIWNLSIQK